jgi:hypothetical protein
MRAIRKPFLTLSLLVAGAVLFVTGPLLICIYKRYRFDHNVRVIVDTTVDPETGPEGASEPCRYIFSLEGAAEPQAVQFSGSGIAHTYDPKTRIHGVTGVGKVIYRERVIELSRLGVLYGGQRLPCSSQPVLILVKENGRIVTGHCELRW